MDAGGGGGASGNASGGGTGASGCCYYALLGIRKNASATDIRTAYRKLALKWHPDRFASNPGAAGEAKRRFQGIQEAYSVLSDKGKRAMYDAGLFDPLDDDQDFSDFMEEMLVMMDNVKNEKPDTLEDLQKMLEDIVGGVGGSRGGVGGRVPSRLAVPAAAAVTGAPVYEMYTRVESCAFFSERDQSLERRRATGQASNGGPLVDKADSNAGCKLVLHFEYGAREEL